VLEQEKKYKEGKIDKYAFIINTTNCAKFLLTPLELKMFVPCDAENNILQVPERWNDWNFGILENFSDELISKCKQYEEAQSRVLFEGFSLTMLPYVSTDSFMLVHHDVGIVVCYHEVNADHICWRFKTMEDLIRCKLPLISEAIQKYNF
jgi:hypothetical protein